MVKRATIAAAFCLSRAAGDLSPTEQGEVLEEANNGPYGRRKHGYAAMQWSDELAAEAQAFASKWTPGSPGAERDPHVRGFHTVKQLLQSWFADSPPMSDGRFKAPGDPRLAISRWYYDAEKTHKPAELYEAGSVGCGQSIYRGDDLHDQYIVVCNYASSGNKEVIPVSSSYIFKEQSTGKECGELPHRLNKDALVGSWGECQSKCDDLDDKCQFFTVYSKYVTGKDKNKFICQLHQTCDKVIDSGDHFSAVFQKQPLEYGKGNADRLLRHHNIMRCMHDAPPLQWSFPASGEAHNYAQTAYEEQRQDFQPETKWNPMPGDFDELEQRVSYKKQPQASLALTRQWWDLTLPIEDWYNNEELRGPLLWPSTAYFGCGGVYEKNVPGAQQLQYYLACNYGPDKSADPSKHLDKTVRPRNKKTAKDCAFSVDSQNRFEAAFPPAPDSAKRVTIAYTPRPRTGLSQQAGDCGEISEYRLVYDAKNDKVQLVGVDPETMDKPNTTPKPCKDSGFDEFHTWGFDTDAYFTDVTGTKKCLNVQPVGVFPPSPETKGTLAVDSSLPCGRHNYFGVKDTVIDLNGAWHFIQDSHSEMCMMDVEEGTGVKSVLDTLPAGYPKEQAVCSGQWTVRAFGDDFDPPVPPPLELNLLEAFKDTDKCPVCRSRVGNFACALPASDTVPLQCALAPTEFDCKQRGGHWCGPQDWKVHGDCPPDSYQCKGAVDPHHADQAGCVQLGGVYKTHFNDCALIADGLYTENDCQNTLKNNNGYEDRDVSDCVNLVKQTHDKTANVFDFVAGYKYDVPQHAPYCRLWQCSELKHNTLPKQDGDQAWLIAYKTKNTLSQNSVPMMV